MTELTRRLVLGGVMGLALACPHVAHAAAQPDDDDYDDEDAGLFRGCELTLSGANFARSGDMRLLRTSGNGWVDSIFAREVNGSMIPLFRHAPYCCFFDDSEGFNAFATPDRLSGGGQGTVAFGVGLMGELFRKFSGTSALSMGDHAATAIFAHEFGHITQFFNPFRGAGKARELHADFMAGWYSGIRALQLYGRQMVNFDEMAREMFDMGDFQFTDPRHHGTPNERVGAFAAGVQLAIGSTGRADVGAAFEVGQRYLGI